MHHHGINISFFIVSSVFISSYLSRTLHHIDSSCSETESSFSLLSSSHVCFRFTEVKKYMHNLKDRAGTAKLIVI